MSCQMKYQFDTNQLQKKIILQFDWIQNHWSPNYTYHREGRHLEVPAPEWVYFIIFQSDSPFWIHNFQLFEIFFTRVIEISFSRVIEGRQHKMEVWQSREQEREAKEREERFLSGYPSHFKFPFFHLWHFWLNFSIKTIFPLWEQEREGKEREERFLSIILQICNFFRREREKGFKEFFSLNKQ